MLLYVSWPSGSASLHLPGVEVCAYIQGAQLGVWVLVVDALLERAHRLFWLHRLGSNDIGYLEVESNILTATRKHNGVSHTCSGMRWRQVGTRTGCCSWPFRSARPEPC